VLEGVARLARHASPFPPPPPALESSAHNPAAGPTLPDVAQPSTQAHPAAPSFVATSSPDQPAAQQSTLLQYLHDQLLRSDDYTRKALLARWLLGLEAELRNRCPRMGAGDVASNRNGNGHDGGEGGAGMHTADLGACAPDCPPPAVL